MPEYDRYIRKAKLLNDLGVNAATLHKWVISGRFPAPVVLNAGQQREIVAWRESDVLAWQQGLPQRLAKVIRKTPYPRGPRTIRNVSKGTEPGKTTKKQNGPALDADDEEPKGPKARKPVIIGRPVK